MKELSIEQKAKRFDEVIEKFDVILNLNTVKKSRTIFADDVRKILPELKKSEDEMIRKALIKYFRNCVSLEGINGEDISNWLEKQGSQKPEEEVDNLHNHLYGEQKSADKLEPKFKVGNWYQCTKDFFGKGVTFDKNTAYYCAKEGCLQDEYGCHIAIVKDLYDNFKLWTIQDAKDGDVLSFDNEDSNYHSIGIFKRIASKNELCGNTYRCYVRYGGFKEKLETPINGDELHHCGTSAHPATKEQRDTLEKAMADAGYTFDFEKKVLKKIEQKHTEWSLPYGKNETAEKLISIAECLEMDGDCLYNGVSGNDYGKFLRVLAIELTEAKPAEWSEEDDYNIQCMIAKVTSDIQEGNVGRNNELIDWLKSLKGRVQPKQE